MSGKGWLAVLCSVMLFFAFTGGPVGAGDADKRYLYKWTDDKGNVGIADDLTKVPPEYRSRVSRTLQPGAGAPSEENAGNDPGREAREIRQRMAAEGEAAVEAADDSDEIKKAEWQQRMADARRSLAAAEARSLQLEQRKSELKAKWGASRSALPPQEVMNEMQRLEADLIAAQKDADRAKKQVEVEIPEEARRAGVPPGWLREIR